MSDFDNDPMNSLLSSFALGPAWARGDKEERKPKAPTRGEDRPPRRDDRDRGPRNDGDRRPPQGRGRPFEDRRGAPTPHQEAPPAAGVRVTIAPDIQAVRLIVKEVQQVARVYPLFDIAKILLAEKSRVRAVFEAQRPQLQQAFMALALASFTLAYADLPTAEMALYLDFLKAEPGQHFTGLSFRALHAAMVDATQELGRRIVRQPGQSRT